MTTTAFTVDFPGIADPESYVLTAHDGTVTLSIRGEDGDLEHLGYTNAEDVDLDALARAIQAKRSRFQDIDLYETVQESM